VLAAGVCDGSALRVAGPGIFYDTLSNHAF